MNLETEQSIRSQEVIFFWRAFNESYHWLEKKVGISKTENYVENQEGRQLIQRFSNQEYSIQWYPIQEFLSLI